MGILARVANECLGLKRLFVVLPCFYAPGNRVMEKLAWRSLPLVGEVFDSGFDSGVRNCPYRAYVFESGEEVLNSWATELNTELRTLLRHIDFKVF